MTPRAEFPTGSRHHSEDRDLGRIGSGERTPFHFWMTEFPETNDQSFRNPRVGRHNLGDRSALTSISVNKCFKGCMRLRPFSPVFVPRRHGAARRNPGVECCHAAVC